MAYKKRKDGRYATRVATGRYDAEGKPIVVNLSAKTQAELREKVSQTKADISRGVYASDGGKTFGAYADAWLRLEKSGLTPIAKKKYRLTVETYLASLRPLRLSEIVRQDILECIAAQEGHPANQLTVKQVSRAILESAIEDGLIVKNVAAKIKLPPRRTPEKRPLTKAEKEACEKIDWEPRELVLITLLRYFGLRSGEIHGLMKNDIDFKKDCVHVRRAVTYDKSQPIIKEPKTAAGRRDVDAPEGVLSRLKPALAKLPGVYLFGDSDGHLMTHGQFRVVWWRCLRKIDAYTGGREKLEAIPLTPHVFRHSYATDLYYAGIDVKDAQRLLGHSSIKVTLEIYTHLTGRSDTKTRLKSLVVIL